MAVRVQAGKYVDIVLAGIILFIFGLIVFAIWSLTSGKGLFGFDPLKPVRDFFGGISKGLASIAELPAKAVGPYGKTEEQVRLEGYYVSYSPLEGSIATKDGQELYWNPTTGTYLTWEEQLQVYPSF